jgi:flagellar motor switch protein FliG
LSEVLFAELSAQELTDLLDGTHPRVLVDALAKEEAPDLAIFLLILQRASQELEKHAAQILAQLPLEIQLSVAKYIAETEISDSEEVDAICTRIVDQIRIAANRTTVFGDGATNLAKLMGQMPLDDQNRLLEVLEEHQPQLVNDVNEQIFTFDDLEHLDNDAIGTVLQMLDPSTIALALHKTSLEMQDKFLRNMPTESATRVEQEMNALTFEQTQIADTARQSVVNAVRRFAAKGIIKLG